MKNAATRTFTGEAQPQARESRRIIEPEDGVMETIQYEKQRGEERKNEQRLRHLENNIQHTSLSVT